MSDVEEPIKFVLYHYTPSLVAAIIFAGIFFASFAFHGYQIFRYKAWYFTAMALGAELEGIGYIGRIMSHNDPEKTMPYVMQSTLLLVSPALMAASIYVVLGRIIVFVEGEKYSLVRINWLTKFFVGGDVISFFIQAGGAGFMASAKTRDNADIGQKIVVGGLCFQIAFFGFFILMSMIFHRRIHSHPTAAAELKSRVNSRFNWRKLLLVLYFASAVIMIRSVYRVVEFLGGRDGTLMRNEIYVYIFDAVLMTLVVIVFNVFHPSRVLPAKKVAGSSTYELAHNHNGV